VSFEEAQGIGEQPPSENAYRILSEVDSTSANPNGDDLSTRVTSLVLFDGVDLSSVSSDSSIVWVESGSVTLTVCEDSRVAVQQAGSTQIELLTAGTYQVDAGGTIFLASEAPYFLTATGGDATITIATHQPRFLRALCGGGSC
jgi:hypothetical protein